MNRRGRGRRGGSSAPSRVAATVHRVLRNEGLNSQACWRLVPTAGPTFDPPAYNEEPVMQRKIRAYISAAALGYSFTYDQVASVYSLNTVYKYVQVYRIDIWGEATAGIMQFTPTSGDGAGVTRDFRDSGVTGARRPHICVSFPEPHLQWFIGTNTTTLGKIVFYDHRGTAVDGNGVIDFHCRFLGNLVKAAPPALYPLLGNTPDLVQESNFTNV